jgi:hypothetical protein
MCLVDKFNDIYDKSGFDGVVEYLEDNLQYGDVERKTDDLIMITTGGFSDDEDLIHSLIHITCRFGRKHYVGYLRGGAYYFSRYRKEYDLIEAKLITRW